MKKILCFVLCLIMTVILFVGCGGEKDTNIGNEKNTLGTSNKQEPVTLTYGLWNSDQAKVLEKIIPVFEEKFSNIKIDMQVTPYKQFFTKLETSAQGSQAPDVFWMNGPRFMKYAANDILLPINKKIEETNYDLGKYPQGLVDLYTYEDKLYGIPKDWDVSALWYNKIMFDDAGVSYPTDNWTWEDMKIAAKQITDKEKGIYGIAARMDTQEGTYNTIPACGGFVISEDRQKSGYNTKENIEGIKVWLDLIDEGASPTAQEMEDTKPLTMFQSNKVAMIMAASWNVPEFMSNENIKEHIDLVQMPSIKGNRGAVIHGLTNVIYSQTKYPEESWEFVKFLGSKEANQIWAESGVVIPAHEDVLGVWKDSYKNINLQAFIDTLEYATMYPATVNTKWFEVEWDTYIGIWNKTMTIEEGTSKIYEQMNDLIKQQR